MELVKAEIENQAVEYLNSLGCKVSDAHKNQFLSICRAFNLNPFLREIYAVPYGDKFNIIVGYEVYLKRAEESQRLNGWRAWTEVKNGDIKGCVEIKRKDWGDSFYHEVSLKEYTSGKNLWASKPETMIKKVAIAQAFRMCFPCELGGIPYTSDEIDIEVKATEKPTETKLLPKNSDSSMARELMELLKDKGLDTKEIKEFCKKHEVSSDDPASIEDMLCNENLNFLISVFKEEKQKDAEATLEAEEAF